MPVLFPNLIMTEVALDGGAVQSAKINDMIMVTTRTAAGTAPNNVATKISSLAEMTAKIGMIPATSIASFEMMRAIAPNANIYVIPGFSTVGSPTQAQHLMAGIDAIKTGAMTIKLAVVTCPEAASLTNAAERSQLFSVGEGAVATNGFDWLFFNNFGLDIQTKAAADAARGSMPSPQGNSTHYFGFTQDASNRNVPLACVAAAYLISLNQNNDGFFSPAANGTIIPGAIPTVYLLGLDDATVVTRDRSFNFPWMTAPGQYQLWGDHTASTDPSWNFISTRLAASTVQSWLSEVLADQIYKPVDAIDSSGEGMRSLQLVGRVTQVMERARAEGALSVPPALPDGAVPPPYRLVTTPIQGGQAVLEVRFCPIRSLRLITVQLTVTQRP